MVSEMNTTRIDQSGSAALTNDSSEEGAERSKLEHFTLKDAPALIEAVFPAQKISFEAQRERKAGAGQTLTALGSYWKGRKPLILVRAIVLAAYFRKLMTLRRIWRSSKN